MNWQSPITVLFLTLAFGTTVLAQQAEQPEVRAFVRGPSFPQSFSELSSAFDASVTPELITMLNSKAEEEHWARIAGMLGVVGDGRAADSLIAFVEKPAPTRLSQRHHDARREAIRALGFLVYRTDNERALRYLIDGLTPSVWRQRNVIGVAPFADSYAEYDLMLSKYALFGLAMSGHRRAGEALRALLHSPTPEQLQFRDLEENTLTQWLEIHDLITKRGMDGMYDYYETQRKLKVERQLEEAKRLREAQQTRP